MRIPRIVGPARWLPTAALYSKIAPIAMMVTMTVLLPSRSFPQSEPASSHIKKPLIYQIGNRVHINATGPRPLLRALDALQQKYGWLVDYEDPQYVAEPSPPPNRRWRRANTEGRADEGFSVEFTTGPTPENPDEGSVLQTLVDAYNEASTAAQFELRMEPGAGVNNKDNKISGPRFDVIGESQRDQQDTAHNPPILDLPITIAKETRTAERTIALICQKLKQKSNISVTMDTNQGAADGDVPWQKTIAVGGVDEHARALLSRVITAMGDRLCWRLLYDPAGKSYVFSIRKISQ